MSIQSVEMLEIRKPTYFTMKSGPVKIKFYDLKLIEPIRLIIDIYRNLLAQPGCVNKNCTDVRANFDVSGDKKCPTHGHHWNAINELLKQHPNAVIRWEQG